MPAKPTIFHVREKNGRYYLIYNEKVGKKWVQRSVKGEAFDKEMDAKIRAAELTVEHSQGKRPVNRDVLFEEVADKWLKVTLSRAKAPKTVECYQTILKHLVKTFGSTPVADITKESIELFLADHAKTRAPRTVNKALNKMKAILELAIDWGYINASPAAKVASYRVRRANIRVFKPHEIARILSYADTIDKIMLLLTYDAGMRIGETLGLRKAQVDLENCSILLGWSEADLKTDAAIRVVPITEEMRDILAAYMGGLVIEPASATEEYEKSPGAIPRKIEFLMALKKHRSVGKAREAVGAGKSMLWYWRQKDEFFGLAVDQLVRQSRLSILVKSPYLFPNEAGKPIPYDNFRKRIWLPLLERAGFDTKDATDRFGSHSLRHSFVSEMIQANEDVLTISRCIGHKDPTTTTREYGHLFAGAQAAAVKRRSARLGDLYGRTMEKPNCENLNS